MQLNRLWSSCIWGNLKSLFDPNFNILISRTKWQLLSHFNFGLVRLLGKLGSCHWYMHVFFWSLSRITKGCNFPSIFRWTLNKVYCFVQPDYEEAQDDRKTASRLVKKRKQLHSSGLSATQNRYMVGEKDENQ